MGSSLRWRIVPFNTDLTELLRATKAKNSVEPDANCVIESMRESIAANISGLGRIGSVKKNSPRILNHSPSHKSISKNPRIR